MIDQRRLRCNHIIVVVQDGSGSNPAVAWRSKPSAVPLKAAECGQAAGASNQSFAVKLDLARSSWQVQRYGSLGKPRIIDVSKPPRPNEFDIV